MANLPQKINQVKLGPLRFKTKSTTSTNKFKLYRLKPRPISRSLNKPKEQPRKCINKNV